MTPTIEILDAEIREPMSAFTDYLITAVAWWLGMRLCFDAAHRAKLGRRLWGLSCLCVGLGALLGGTSHGFAQYLNDAANLFVWKGTVYAIGCSMLLAVAGTLEGSYLGKRSRRSLHAINIIGFCAYAVWMIEHSDFLYVIYHYVPAMIGIAAIQAWALARHRAKSAPWMIAGVTTTLLGAYIQQSGFSLHRHFNHNDIFHVVQIAGIFLLYRGVVALNGGIAGERGHDRIAARTGLHE